MIYIIHVSIEIFRLRHSLRWPVYKRTLPLEKESQRESLSPQVFLEGGGICTQASQNTGVPLVKWLRGQGATRAWSWLKIHYLFSWLLSKETKRQLKQTNLYCFTISSILYQSHLFLSFAECWNLQRTLLVDTQISGREDRKIQIRPVIGIIPQK